MQLWGKSVCSAGKFPVGYIVVSLHIPKRMKSTRKVDAAQKKPKTQTQPLVATPTPPPLVELCQPSER